MTERLLVNVFCGLLVGGLPGGFLGPPGGLRPAKLVPDVCFVGVPCVFVVCPMAFGRSFGGGFHIYFVLQLRRSGSHPDKENQKHAKNV